MQITHLPLVRTALLINACFSLLTGGLALAYSAPLTDHLGLPDGPWVAGTGIVLLLFAGNIAWALRRGPRKAELLYFVASDLGWVLGSLIVAFGFPGLLSPEGRALILALAIPVAMLACFQSMGLGRRAADLPA